MFTSIYSNIEVGIQLDNDLLEYMKYLYTYIEKTTKILGINIINKISNIKMFALGLYTQNDYDIINNFANNLKKQFEEKFDFDECNIYKFLAFS